MNKTKLFIATLTASALVVGGGAMAGCGHSHTYSDEWKTNETAHWHVATCDDLKESDEAYKKDYGEHVWGDDNECDTCHYVKKGTENPPPADKTEYTVTLNVGTNGTLEAGASTTLTTVNGKLASLPTPTANENYTFKGWYTSAEGGEKVTTDYAFTGETKTVTIYAQYEDATAPVVEYTITLHVGDGTLETGAVTTYTTVNGKLPFGEEDFLPEPTIATAHWHFDNWYDAETDGNAIDEHETIFTADTDIYARYVRDNGLWSANGNEYLHNLVLNSGCEDHVQYWLGGDSIELDEGAEVSLYLDGKLMTYTVKQNSTCINLPNSSARVTSVTVKEDAKFVLYLNEWGPNNWQVEYTGTALNASTVSEIPVGCDAITVTATNGSIKLYVVAEDGTALNSENWGAHRFYSWSDEIFGNWGGSLEQGKLNSTITCTGNITANFGFKVRWETETNKFSTDGNGGEQSGNIMGLEVGKTYVINLSVAKDKAFLYTGTESGGTTTPEPTTPAEPQE